MALLIGCVNFNIPSQYNLDTPSVLLLYLLQPIQCLRRPFFCYVSLSPLYFNLNQSAHFCMNDLTIFNNLYPDRPLRIFPLIGSIILFLLYINGPLNMFRLFQLPLIIPLYSYVVFQMYSSLSVNIFIGFHFVLPIFYYTTIDSSQYFSSE